MFAKKLSWDRYPIGKPLNKMKPSCFGLIYFSSDLSTILTKFWYNVNIKVCFRGVTGKEQCSPVSRRASFFLCRGKTFSSSPTPASACRMRVSTTGATTPSTSTPSTAQVTWPEVPGLLLWKRRVRHFNEFFNVCFCTLWRNHVFSSSSCHTFWPSECKGKCEL